MKKIFLICLAFIALITTTTLAKPKQIKFCTISFPPFVIADENKPIDGFDIDLAKAICRKIGYKCEFILKQEFTTMAADLNSNECDAWITGITISPGRKKHMDFTNAYYPSSVSFISTKNSKLTSSPNDLKGKKIGVAQGTNFIDFLTVTFGFEATIIQFANDQDTMEALKTNKIDAAINDTPVLQYWIQQKGNEGFRLIDLPIFNKEFSHGSGYGISIKKGNTKLLNLLNNAITKIKTDNTYNNLVKKYFKNN